MAASSIRKSAGRIIFIGIILLLICISLASAEDLFAAGEQNLKDHGLVLEDIINEYSEFGNSGNGFSGFWLPYMEDGTPSFCLFDVTGDGCVDLVTGRMFGSGMVRLEVVVMDPLSHEIYVLDGYNDDYSVADVTADRLTVEKRGPNGYNEPNTTTLGTIKLEDGQLVFVPDDPQEAVSPSLTSSEEAVETIRFPFTGFEVDFPPTSEINGVLQVSNDIELMDNVHYADLEYFAIPKEKSGFLSNIGIGLTAEENALVFHNALPLLRVISIENGTIDDLPQNVKEDYETESYLELGSFGEYNYYVRYPGQADYEWANKFTEETKQEIDYLISYFQEEGRLRFFRPETVTGHLLEFETTDLDGNPVRSAELFGKNKLTVLNVWATWCGPCKNELPSLHILNQKMKEQDIEVVGVVINVRNQADSETISEAQKYMSWYKADYLNLVPWEGFMDMLPVYGYPTTYYIDAKGQVVREDQSGAHNTQEYKAIIKEILAEMEQ